MTNTDKTRQKLVDSMRKTKAEADTSPTKASAPKAKKTHVRRASTIPTGDAGRVKTKPSARSAKPTQTPSDPYQGARRVWPD
jgi:hypothetical protein